METKPMETKPVETKPVEAKLTKPFEHLSGHAYLNLETFRRNGTGVRTPVWFVLDEHCVYVRTIANSGKVKRIRNHSQVQVAPCKVNGDLVGDWQPAVARELEAGGEMGPKISRMLRQKYGLQAVFFSLMSALRREKYTLIEIKPAP